MKVTIDRDKCIASGACVLANPNVFAQDDDGIVWLLQEHPGEEQAEATRDAMFACPAMVIEVDE
jgi:ferredoxin